jgi:RAB protein geranylgeranyltransferase component A
MILYGIFLFSGSKEEFYKVPFDSGLAKAKLYLQSLGRFCKNGFLAGMYGVGSELSQGFCRSSAVYGGTFMLNTPIDKITQDQDGFKVYSQDQIFNCKKLIASTDFSIYYNGLKSTFSR